MARLEDHLVLVAMIDGVAQTKVSSVTVNGQSNAQAVETILEGLAGKTPGAARLEISGNWAVALNGLEFDFFTACALGTYHSLQIPLGAKSIVTNGWFDTTGISQSVNSSTEATCSFIAQFNAPE